uniref:HAT C-terminal dimerisation domain-containing protein n=1 Tax=Aegilops tauschii subsp. strangulata TaxID=200361 RepID=A0A453BF28_AEGTS
MGPADILEVFLKRPFYPIAIFSYRILLTIPVTVASAERSFSKLKLLKSYLRSTMTQERLNGLATVALENDVLEKINYEDIIEDFISRNTRRMTLFNRA